MLQQIYENIRTLLNEKIDALRELARQLETKETIDGDTVSRILHNPQKSREVSQV